MIDPTTIKRIEAVEAMAFALLKEATDLRKSLSLVQGGGSRKGPLTEEQRQRIISQRRKNSVKPR